MSTTQPLIDGLTPAPGNAPSPAAADATRVNGAWKPPANSPYAVEDTPRGAQGKGARKATSPSQSNMRIVGDDPAERARYAAQQNKAHVGAPAIIPGTMEYGEPDFVFDESDEDYDEARRIAERDARRAQRASQKRPAEASEKPARKQSPGRVKKNRANAEPDDDWGSASADEPAQEQLSSAPQPNPIKAHRAKVAQKKAEEKKIKERRRARSAKMVTPAQHVYQVALIWATAALTVVATVALLFQPAQDLYRSYRENERLNDELSQYYMRNDALERRVAYLQTEAGIQDEARLNYGLIMPDENAVIVTGVDTSTTSAPSWSAPAEVRRGSGQNSQSVLTDIFDAVFGVNATSELVSSDPLSPELRQAVIAAYGSDINGGGSPLNDAAYIARVRPQVVRYTQQVAESQGEVAAVPAPTTDGQSDSQAQDVAEERVEVSDVLHPDATVVEPGIAEGTEGQVDPYAQADPYAADPYATGEQYTEPAYDQQPAEYVETPSETYDVYEAPVYDQAAEYTEPAVYDEYSEYGYDPNADIVVEPGY